MFEQLKQAIANNDNKEPPDMYNWYDLIRDLENLVPPIMHFEGWKGYVKKAARILFFREVCQNEEIKSTKDLGSGALWEIHKFLNHEICGIENCNEVTTWYQENTRKIYDYAPFVKSAKLKADKANRDKKKRINKAAHQMGDVGDNVPF